MREKMGYLPSEELFCSILDGMRDREDAARELDAYMGNHEEFAASRDFFSGHCLVASGAQEIVDLLSAVFDAKDEIEFFCFECDYGRKWKPGDFTEDGWDVDMSSSRALYEHLIGRLQSE